LLALSLWSVFFHTSEIKIKCYLGSKSASITASVDPFGSFFLDSTLKFSVLNVAPSAIQKVLRVFGSFLVTFISLASVVEGLWFLLKCFNEGSAGQFPDLPYFLALSSFVWRSFPPLASSSTAFSSLFRNPSD